jgi:hypothetical protein
MASHPLTNDGIYLVADVTARRQFAARQRPKAADCFDNGHVVGQQLSRFRIMNG